jgi:hypothetical protein
MKVAGVAEAGQMLMLAGPDEGGVKVTTADADLVASATLVAVTVTVWAEVIEAGAVYTPAFNDPMAGFKDQVTAVLLDPVTVAENCAVWPLDRVAVNGVMLTATLTGLPIVSEPGTAVIELVEPSISAPTILVS